MTQIRLSDYSIHKLLKRCQELEKRGYECVRRILQEGDKYIVVYDNGTKGKLNYVNNSFENKWSERLGRIKI